MKPSDKVPMAAIFAFYILGVCTMLPWNFFITADTYWQYKLRNVSLGEDWNAPGTPSTSLQISFTPALVIIANLFTFLFTLGTSGVTRWVGEKERIYGSLILSFFTMATFTILAIVNTDQWQLTFYVITLTMTAVLNAGIAILQASLFGTVGLFPESCITSMLSGQSIAGIISSVAQIISLAIGNADPIISGIIYFCIANVFIIISIGTYMHLIKSEIYKEANANAHEDKNNFKKTTTMKEYISILKKILWMGIAAGNVLFITLAIFPAVQVYVTSTYVGTVWGDVYFQPTITFLIFNVMDMVGREMVKYIQWPSHKGWLLQVAVVSRIVFIPLILLCNGDNKSFPTVFHQDFYYIILNTLFALTNGYFISLTMIYYPKFISEGETDIAGALMATLLGVGMVLGSAASPGFVALWKPNVNY